MKDLVLKHAHYDSPLFLGNLPGILNNIFLLWKIF